MTKIYITDRFATGTRKTLDNGTMKVQVVLARSGMFDYLGSELGLTGADATRMLKVYRPPEAIFSKKSMDSFKLLPLTINHPAEMVDLVNVKDVQNGVVGEDVRQVGTDLTGEILITTAEGISALDEMNELSIGFYAFYEIGAGQTPEGETYDAKQLALEGNHVALVPAGRCGASCKVLDNIPNGDTTMGDIVIKIGTVDCKVPEAIAPLIANTIQTANDKVVSLTEEVATQSTTISTHEATIDSLNTELATSKEASSDAVIAQAVQDRVSLVEAVKSIDDTIVCEGKDSLTLMKEALVSQDSALVFEGNKAEPAYIQAYFDIACAKVDKVDALDSALKKNAKNPATKNVVTDARAAFIKRGNDTFIGNQGVA